MAMMKPAAFRRLCVETLVWSIWAIFSFQPPSGGCVLKPGRLGLDSRRSLQPPSGGCVLKLNQVKTYEDGVRSRLQAAVC